jgi:hypothetical protein
MVCVWFLERGCVGGRETDRQGGGKGVIRPGKLEKKAVGKGTWGRGRVDV